MPNILEYIYTRIFEYTRATLPHLFVPGGQTNFSYRSEGGQTVCLPPGEGGSKHFSYKGGTNIFVSRGVQSFYTGRGEQIFYDGGAGGYDDFEEEMNVNEANFLVSKVSKLSAGARILV